MLDRTTLELLRRQNEERRREENPLARTVILQDDKTGVTAILDVDDVRDRQGRGLNGNEKTQAYANRFLVLA